MQDADPDAVTRRTAWVSGVLMLVFLGGIVLLFLFGGDAQPLAESATSPTITP